MICQPDVHIFEWIYLKFKTDKIKRILKSLACQLDLEHGGLALQHLGFAAAEEKPLAFLES